MGRWVMMDRQLGNVAKKPSTGCQIESEQFFLAADEKTRLEASRVQKSIAPDD
jgi:hypothetical protein